MSSFANGAVCGRSAAHDAGWLLASAVVITGHGLVTAGPSDEWIRAFARVERHDRGGHGGGKPRHDRPAPDRWGQGSTMPRSWSRSSRGTLLDQRSVRARPRVLRRKIALEDSGHDRHRRGGSPLASASYEHRPELFSWPGASSPRPRSRKMTSLRASNASRQDGPVHGADDRNRRCRRRAKERRCDRRSAASPAPDWIVTLRLEKRR